MGNNRNLLFYVQDAGGIHPRSIGNVPIDFHLSMAFQSALASDIISASTLNGDKSYDFFSWGFEELTADTKVSEIQNPGIVIAICRENFQDTYFEAQILRFKAENLENSVQQKFLQSFIKGHNGDFSPFTFHVFLSYSKKDLDLASEMRYELQANGFRCFMASEDIGAGIIWEPTIKKALKMSKAVVLLLTPNSIKSKWVLCEAGASWVLDKPMFPATMFIKNSDLPEPISKNQTISIETQNGRRKLIKALKDKGIKDKSIKRQRH